MYVRLCVCCRWTSTVVWGECELLCDVCMTLNRYYTCGCYFMHSVCIYVPGYGQITVEVLPNYFIIKICPHVRDTSTCDVAFENI